MKKHHHFDDRDGSESHDDFDIHADVAALDYASVFTLELLHAGFSWTPILQGGVPTFVGKPLAHSGAITHSHFPKPAPGGHTLAPEIAAAPPPPPPTISQAQVDAFSAGFEATLNGIEGNLVEQVFGDTLPLLGDNLADAAAGGVPALHYVTALKTALKSGLATLSGGGSYTEAQVETALFSALNAAGIAAGGGPQIDLANPNDIKLTLTSTKSFAAFDAPLEANLDLPGLGFTTSGTARSTLGYTLNFGVGLDAAGFYLNSTPGGSAFNVVLDTKIPGFNASAHLGPLRFTATDATALSPTDFNAVFLLALKDPNSDGHLRAGELGGDLVDGTLNGNAGVRLHLASDLGTAVLPDLAADLDFNWGFNAAVVDAAAGNATFGNAPTVAFRNVSLGLGSFFSDFVTPVFGAVQTLTDPLQPVVDVLKTKIGFLSELAGQDVTLLDVAGGIGALSPETVARLDLYASLINFINSVPSGGGSARIDLGDFSLGAQDPRAAIFQLANAVPQSIRAALAPGSQSAQLGGFLSGKNALPGGGLSFPIIENPTTAINLLFGEPVDFFTYHVPGLDINHQGYDEFYPIFGPFGVRLQATVDAHAYLDIGYDSAGLATFAATGDGADIFNGFFVVDHPGPEATLTANLSAFAAVNIVVAEMGVGGGITGNLNVFLNDTDGAIDGRIHLAQLANSCLFSLSGDVSAGLSAYLTVGFGPFSETTEHDFGHEVLVSFNATGCDVAGMPGVPVLAHTAGASVALHVGADSSLRQVGSPEDGADDFFAFHVSGAAGSEVVGVVGNGLRTEAGGPVAPQNFTVGANGRITADGGERDDTLALALEVISPATLRGGAGNDLLIGALGDDQLFGDAGFDRLVGGPGADTLNGGADQDYLDGQDGDDTLLGGSEADILHGGAGADVLNGGPGFDTATYFLSPIGVFINLAVPGSGGGDAQGDTYLSIERIVGSPFADILFGTTGSDNFGGGAGDDLLDGKAGDDLLVGDAGADTLTGGAGNDFAAYSLSPAAVAVSLFTGIGNGGDAQGDTLSGIENLQGSDFGDTLEGDNGANWLRGLDGANTLRGLGGDDLLEGGKDGDILEGGDGADTLRASLDVASLDPGVSGGIDTLRGGAGNDFLYGDAGGDTLDGGDGADQIFGGKDNDMILGGAGNDLVYGGAGIDTISGGDDADTLHGDAGADVIDGNAGNDALDGNDGADTLTDLTGNNQLYGGAENDSLTAGAGSDLLDGGTGNDSLNAGDGVNTLLGGDGDDALLSGSGADNLDGGIGNDTAASGAGNDLVLGGDGNDSLDAGIGSDRVEGGNGNDFLSVGALRALVQDPERLDHLFGGAGLDTISADFSNQTIAMIVTAGPTQSLVFADGTEARDFENVHDLFTGSGDEVLHLDGAADDHFGNLLKTGAGNDTIFSGDGNDNVDAGDGDDFVNGGSDIGTLVLEPGTNIVVSFTFSGGIGDVLAGGAGNDTVSFDQLNFQIRTVFGEIVGAGVDVNLSTNATDRAAKGISISGFENIIGTNYADNLTGDNGPNIIQPLRGGGWTSSGSAGSEQIDGLGGEDTLRIDFSLADLADAEGVRTNGYSMDRLSLDHSKSYDSYLYYNIEHFDITGASKADGLYSNVVGYSDILRGLGGNDTLGGNGGADTLLGGDGNDVLTAQGKFLVPSIPQFGYDGIAGGHDVLDGGTGDDLVEDIAFLNSAPLLGPDALFQLDGGTGFDTLSADFSNQTAAIIWDSAAPVNLEFSDGAYARNFEVLRYFASGPGNDAIAQRGRVDNLFYLGAGNDTVNPGLGVDSVRGGAGFDVAILDFSVGDTAEMAGVIGYGDSSGVSIYRSLLADIFNRPDNIYVTEFESVRITGTSKADTFGGTYGDDVLLGGAGNDVLSGYFGGNDLLDGGEGDDTLTGAYPNYSGPNTGHDTLLGGAGADTIYGNHGNDTILGGDGNDTISAGDRNLGGGYAYGLDVIDGGAGDDFITDGFFNSGYSYSTAGARLQLDGGTGFDTLSADFGIETQAIVFDATNPTATNSAGGSYLRNFEALANFTSGSGNDVLIQPGRVNNILSTGAGNDVVNPGLGIDFAAGGFGDDLLILDYSQGDTPNVGGVLFEGGQYFRRYDLGSGALLDSIYTSGFDRVQITGGSKADTFIGLDGNDVFHTDAGNDAITSGNGDDVLDGGAGADTMTGGLGDDFYYVDDPGDVINEGVGGGYDTAVFTVGGSFTQPANVEKIIFLGSTTLPSLVIGPGGVVILGGNPPAPPAPPASAADFALDAIARAQAVAGTRPAIGNTVATIPEFTVGAAHDAAANIAIADPTTPFSELFAHGFTNHADTTHDLWHHDAPLAPPDFDVIDAIV